MLRSDPEGEDLPPDAYVFGDEIGQSISSVKTAWRTACSQACIADLHFHDLRREFACRLLESRAELHDVRDFLGHANITTTSRYLRSTTLRLERALTLLEEREERQASATDERSGKESSRKSATSGTHGRKSRLEMENPLDAETADLIEDVVVSPEGIEP
jgi:hypothetical protein